jgi:hypothetical protein
MMLSFFVPRSRAERDISRDFCDRIPILRAAAEPKPEIDAADITAAAFPGLAESPARARL